MDFRVKKRGGYQAPRESSTIEVAAQSSDMKGSKRDWIFRVQVIYKRCNFCFIISLNISK